MVFSRPRRGLWPFLFSLSSTQKKKRTTMADDDLDFDFEGTLAKEAETYQGASVS